jgi:hypothetical protein
VCDDRQTHPGVVATGGGCGLWKRGRPYVARSRVRHLRIVIS